MIETAWKRRRWIGEFMAGEKDRRSLTAWLMLRGMICKDVFVCTASGLTNLSYI
jgi:hypothetical protein